MAHSEVVAYQNRVYAPVLIINRIFRVSCPLIHFMNQTLYTLVLNAMHIL